MINKIAQQTHKNEGLIVTITKHTIKGNEFVFNLNND